MTSCWGVYGLVYLETMARGCKAIVTKNEGIDGIIKNGLIFFVMRDMFMTSLTTLLYINSLSPQHLENIFVRPIPIAKMLTDRNAAKNYFDNLYD